MGRRELAGRVCMERARNSRWNVKGRREIAFSNKCEPNEPVALRFDLLFVQVFIPPSLAPDVLNHDRPSPPVVY